MRMHALPCESISKAGVHYQHNGPADGCSCHTGLSALEDHSRPTASLRGRPGGRGTGQGRVARGLCEPLTGSYRSSPDHRLHFHSVLVSVKIDARRFTGHDMLSLGTVMLQEISHFRLDLFFFRLSSYSLHSHHVTLSVVRCSNEVTYLFEMSYKQKSCLHRTRTADFVLRHPRTSILKVSFWKGSCMYEQGRLQLLWCPHARQT